MCWNAIPNAHCTSEKIPYEQDYTEYENLIYLGTIERCTAVTSTELLELKECLIQLNFTENYKGIHE